jgi:hypothetical protein
LGFFLKDLLIACPWAIMIFAIGFWIFDIVNNSLQSPYWALFVDFTRKDEKKIWRANFFYSLFMGLAIF